MRIVVTGGRHYFNAGTVASVLRAIDFYDGINVLAHGGATGADAHADAWANDNLPAAAIHVYHPDWAQFGKAAGPRRNERMLNEEKPDLVVAFPGGRGTADCVARAREMGIKVLEVE